MHLHGSRLDHALIVSSLFLISTSANASSLLEKLRDGLTLRLEYTDCAVPGHRPRYTVLASSLRLRGDTISVHSNGVPGSYSPSTKAFHTSAISGNTILLHFVASTQSISVSQDGASCSLRSSCYGGREGHAVWCAVTSSPAVVERPSPTESAPVGTKKLATANTLQASQGTYSDITGTGGGSSSPANCNPSAGNNAPKTQSIQIQPVTAQTAANSNAAIQATIQKLRASAAALQAAGDLAEAASLNDQAQSMQDVANERAASCPPLGPATYWLGKPDDEEYCASANCFERGTAYYGARCFPDHRQDFSKEQRQLLCRQFLTKLQPFAVDHDQQWLADEMKRSVPSCNADGTPRSLRDIIRDSLAAHQ
jgi:hypothetical protein